MKRLIPVFISLVFVASFAGCGDINEPVTKATQLKTVLAIDYERYMADYPDKPPPIHTYHKDMNCTVWRSQLKLYEEYAITLIDDVAKSRGYRPCSTCKP